MVAGKPSVGAVSDDARAARGFIVVAVLWMLAALSALVLIYLSFVTNSAVVVAVSSGRVQAEALETAAVELAVYRLTGVKADARPGTGSFEARVGRGRVSVSFLSEAARIDLNAAPKALLAGLMTGLGAAPSDAENYADRIVAWRMPSTATGDDDPENAAYRTAGIPYLPRHSLFPSAEELWLVHGLPSLMVERMLPFVTVFSAQAAVNPVVAAPQVIAALPGMTPERLQDVLAQRANPALDPKSLLGIVGGEAVSVTNSTAYRMTIVVEPDHARPATAEIVVGLSENGNLPYQIMSWRDAADQGAAEHRGTPP